MAQLRRDHEKYDSLDTEIVIIGPEDGPAFRKYWTSNGLGFIGLPDPEHQVLKRYGQEINLFKLGRMPAMIVVDKAGIARFVHYGHSMSDIPENKEILAAIRGMNRERMPARSTWHQAASPAG